ncbi:MAG: hypothetical protein VKI81_05805 [Synechococcaceae cyanobacterium]|nr:hypothetical protein [Synechococcaceae cyanobacterium]
MLRSFLRRAPVLWVPPLLAGAVATAALAEPVPRPDGLVVLQETVTRQGVEVIGVYGAEDDPVQAGVRRVKVWRELPDRVTVSTDVVHCSPEGPMRITGDDRRLILRELNPGGAITPLNRLDHLIWWAACQPDQAGRDPATLAPLARRLGYSGTLPEREQFLPKPRR